VQDVHMCDVNRLGCWKVMFFDRLPRDVYVPIRSDRDHDRHVLSAVPAYQQGVMSVTA